MSLQSPIQQKKTETGRRVVVDSTQDSFPRGSKGNKKHTQQTTNIQSLQRLQDYQLLLVSSVLVLDVFAFDCGCQLPTWYEINNSVNKMKSPHTQFSLMLFTSLNCFSFE